MVRGLAAAKIVVVQRGKIVMNQRIGVNEFQRATDVHGPVLLDGKHPRGFHAQDGTDALAAGENAVAHGAMDGSRKRMLRREKLLQGRFHYTAVLLEKVGDGHRV